jgi:uncharacterized membrane protein
MPTSSVFVLIRVPRRLVAKHACVRPAYRLVYAAVNRYEWLLFFHIAASIVWLGGALAVQVLAFRANRADDPARMTTIAHEIEWIGTRIFLPASLLVLVLGIILAVDGPWDFGQTWIILALIGFGLSFVTGAAFLGPESGRIGKLLAADGPESLAVRDRIQRIFLVSRIELVLLYLIVLDMVVKPGL